MQVKRAIQTPHQRGGSSYRMRLLGTIQDSPLDDAAENRDAQDPWAPSGLGRGAGRARAEAMEGGTRAVG